MSKWLSEGLDDTTAVKHTSPIQILTNIHPPPTISPVNEANHYLRQLRQEIAHSYTLEELETAVFDLNLNWDELAGDALTPKIRSLLLHLSQQNRLPDLITLLRQERPHIQWADPPTSIKVPPAAPTSANGRIRQALLQKVRHYWIEGVLEKSLQQHTELQLSLTTAPQTIAQPRMLTLEQATPKAIPANTPILTLFEQANRALLILGDPGSGKTTLLLQLARDLLELAEFDTNQPIPLLFNLSTWGQNQEPLFAWLIQELQLSYQVNKNFAANWLQTEPIRLLLDGLDEVAAEHRAACVTAINQFRQEYGLTDIVICSRADDYITLNNTLQLTGAIRIQPLTSQQIDSYLVKAGEMLGGVRTAVHSDPILQELAQSPLTLNILSRAYPDHTAELLTDGSLSQRRQHLFATYVQRMFARRYSQSPHDPQQATHWLAWLANQMKQHNQTIFHLEQIQPSWLPTAAQKKRLQPPSQTHLRLGRRFNRGVSFLVSFYN